jgi:hypothetical protein
MSNLTNHGRRYLALYLRHFYEGRISFREATALLGACFLERVK